MPQGLNASIELGAGGMRAQPVKIRRPLRSNGQRVVNHTQKLSSNPFYKCKYCSNLLSKVLGRPPLRAPTAPPPADAQSSWDPWAPQEPQDRPKTPKIGPKRPPDRPKIVLRRPRSAPDRPKMRQDRPKMPQERSKSAQEGSWNDFGIILWHFGAILGSKMCVFYYVLQFFL